MTFAVTAAVVSSAAAVGGAALSASAASSASKRAIAAQAAENEKARQMTPEELRYFNHTMKQADLNYALVRDSVASNSDYRSSLQPILAQQNSLWMAETARLFPELNIQAASQAIGGGIPSIEQIRSAAPSGGSSVLNSLDQQSAAQAQSDSAHEAQIVNQLRSTASSMLSGGGSNAQALLQMLNSNAPLSQIKPAISNLIATHQGAQNQAVFNGWLNIANTPSPRLPPGQQQPTNIGTVPLPNPQTGAIPAPGASPTAPPPPAAPQGTISDTAIGVASQAEPGSSDVALNTAVAFITDSLSKLQQGFQITPEQNFQIESAIDAARARALTDVERQRADGLRSVFQEVAPSLGLRAGDTPNLDRAGFVVREAQRQMGNVNSDLAAQEAKMKLDVPLAYGQAQAQGVAQAGQALTGTGSVQANVEQNATANRLGLIGGVSTLGQNVQSQGLDLAAAAAPGTPQFPNRAMGQLPVINPNTDVYAKAGLGIAQGIRDIDFTKKPEPFKASSDLMK